MINGRDIFVDNYRLILGPMIRLIHFTLTLVSTSVRSRLSLQAENAALRNQLSLYRKSGQRPRIKPADRLLWCFIAKFWSGWRAALYFVQPRTVTTWQKNDSATTGAHSVSRIRPADLGSRENSESSLVGCGKPIRRGAHQRSSLNLRCLESTLPSQR